MDNPILIQYNNLIEEDIVDVISELSDNGIYVESKAQNIGVYNSLEWLLPPAVLYFITKQFFDSFFKEAGKDAYNLLKESTKKLIHKIKNRNLIYINSSGQTKPQNLIAFVFELDKDIKLRFIFGSELKDKIEIAIDKCLEYLQPHKQQELYVRINNFTQHIGSPKAIIYLEFDIHVNDWVCFEPLEKMKQEREKLK